MAQIVFIQDGANLGNATVHHIRWGYHISAGLCMRQGGFCQQIQGGIIVDDVAVENTAMPVVHIGTQTNIRDDHQFRYFIFQCSDGVLNDTVIGVSPAGQFIFSIRNSK